MDATVRLDHELLAVEGEHTVHAMLELVAPAAPEAKDRPALNLALVIDRSSSMSGPKLEHTKAAAEYLIKRLGSQDKMALVTYDDDVELRASLGTCDQAMLTALVHSIFPGGCTNLSGGWLKGAEELGRATGDGVRKVSAPDRWASEPGDRRHRVAREDGDGDARSRGRHHDDRVRRWLQRRAPHGHGRWGRWERLLRGLAGRRARHLRAGVHRPGEPRRAEPQRRDQAVRRGQGAGIPQRLPRDRSCRRSAVVSR